MTVIVRRRVEDDLDACERLANEVWQTDGYPVYGSDDLRGFIAVADALDAWVVEDAGAMIGHVAIRPSGLPEVMALAREATGQPIERLCAVSRLLVSSSARRRGVGMRLLETATTGALARGLQPILDVVAASPAVAFYEASGWRPVGTVQVRLPRGAAIDERVFVGPLAR